METAFAPRRSVPSFIARFLIAKISTFLFLLCRCIYEIEGTMDVSGLEVSEAALPPETL
jgi:hypothetical protein